MMTKKQFEALSPKERGYAVYMCGRREDEPNIPDEINPYAHGSAQAKQWNEGQRLAVFAVMDGDDE